MKMHSVCMLSERESTFGESESGKKTSLHLNNILLNENALRVYVRCSREKVLLEVKVEKPSLRFCGEYY